MVSVPLPQNKAGNKGVFWTNIETMNIKYPNRELLY